VVGSGEEYGLVEEENQPITEDAPLRPMSPYGMSKACQEMVCMQAALAGELPVVMTRSFNHTGPGQSADFVCPDFAQQVARISLAEQEPVITVGNIDVVRDFSDVRDVVRAYRLLAERGDSGKAYNVSSGRGVSIREMLDSLIRIGGIEAEVKEDPRRFRPAEIPVLVGDNRATCRGVGWQPRISFEQTLTETFEFWRGRLS
jgi:GDP-4-dehydro-6-deoxy-D-mannose reductase